MSLACHLDLPKPFLKGKVLFQSNYLSNFLAQLTAGKTLRRPSFTNHSHAISILHYSTRFSLIYVLTVEPWTFCTMDIQELQFISTCFHMDSILVILLYSEC